jgi:hypothetical protein
MRKSFRQRRRQRAEMLLADLLTSRNQCACRLIWREWDVNARNGLRGLRESHYSVAAGLCRYYAGLVAVDWTETERAAIDDGLTRFPVTSGKCAALARIVHGEGAKRDNSTKGRQITPANAARFVVPKHSSAPRWFSHTFVETHRHSVDALTGINGCPVDAYLATHWSYIECLRVVDVDVATVDPGIQGAT